MVAPPNIGPRTTPKYGDLAKAGIHELSDGTSVFAGQRDDPFFADVALDLRPGRPAAVQRRPTSSRSTTSKGVDSLAGYNVNTIAIQVPIADADQRRRARAGRRRRPQRGHRRLGRRQPRQSMAVDGGEGDWVQVSRLGNPLINEVIIPLGQKDAWNASNPADDAQYEQFYLNSELAAIVNTIYPTLPDARTTDRSDLVLILGQGVPGLNQTNTEGLFDMLRLNLARAAHGQARPAGAPLAGDIAGFPNGRRLTDDVVDIELRAVADGYGTFLAEAFGLPNL